MNKLEQIMRALDFKRVSHFAEFLGKDKGSVNKYIKNERNLGGGFILDLKAKIPNLNLRFFDSDREPMFIENRTKSTEDNQIVSRGTSERIYPIYGRVAAGSPIATWGEGEFTMSISGHPKLDKIKDKVFGFIVEGDSMEGVYSNGDLVFVTQLTTQKPKDKDYVVTYFDSDPDTARATVKRFQWIDKDKGQFLLKSKNPAYNDTLHTFKEVRKMFKVIFGFTFPESKN